MVEREKRGISDVALIRLEQVSPFPFDALASVLDEYPAAARKSVRWVQEEPQNQGAWSFVEPRYARAFGPISYVGAEPMAASATGIHAHHVESRKQLYDDVFGKQK